MHKRYITIILTLLIGLGGASSAAYAGNCAGQGTCVPVHRSDHAADATAHHCSCSLNFAEMADAACRLAMLLQSSAQRLLPLSHNHTRLAGLDTAIPNHDWMSIFGRSSNTHELNKTESPLAYPIYLQTLALLC
jgi:hypothetical protein